MNHTTIAAQPSARAVEKNPPSYFDWLKAMRGDGLLRELANRDGAKDIRYTAIVVASYGRNGTGCYPSIATLAEDTGIKSDKTIRAHLKLLVAHGWLTPTGKAARGVTVYSISVPDPGNPDYRSETCQVGNLDYRSEIRDPGNENSQVGNLDYRTTPVTQTTDNQEYNQEYKDIEQEYECGSVTATDTLGSDLKNGDADASPDVKKKIEPAPQGPWCETCSEPILSGILKDIPHDTPVRWDEATDKMIITGIVHEWMCRSCGRDANTIETRFDADGYSWLRCGGCFALNRPDGYTIIKPDTVTRG